MLKAYTSVILIPDTDGCVSHPCQHSGTCTDQMYSFTCTCQ